MLDYLANTFLLFSRDSFVIPLIVIGLIWLDRKTFYHATCLIFLSMLFNVALKVSFRIPLSPLLGKEGFAFPSGHMQFVTSFYGWLAWQSKNRWIQGGILILLVGIALSLIHFGYHNGFDVLGAVFFALLLVSSYTLVDLKWPKALPWLVLGFATCLLVYIAIRSSIAPHVWMAYYGLGGFILAEQLVKGFKFAKLTAFFLCFISIITISYFFRYVLGPQPIPVYQLQWLIIGFVISCFAPKSSLQAT